MATGERVPTTGKAERLGANVVFIMKTMLASLLPAPLDAHQVRPTKNGMEYATFAALWPLTNPHVKKLGAYSE